ncbi:uncharacterized protein LOC131803059 [Musca domestica]|uniref:Uncharacterized protein LOC131803059 n=1 Tax=Musca domestica TaxID=7370 RepID=A0ABM3V2F9_MUSDO|nr:uncharacterized protein LOC131803059 [Musca domestica]
MLSWFNRIQSTIIIGCLNIFIYCMFAAVILENLEYDRFHEYDYDDYSDIYKSYEQREHRKLYCMIYVIMCGIMMLLSALLIWGTVKKRPPYMAPWLLGSFVVLVYSSIVVLDDIFLKSSFVGVANAFLFFTILFIVFGFQTFCLALVYSVYRNFQLEIALKYSRKQLHEEIQQECLEEIAPTLATEIKSESKLKATRKNRIGS